MNPSFTFSLFLLLLLPTLSLSSCQCTPNTKDIQDFKNSILIKSIALVSILAAGFAGVLLPILGRSIPFLRPENNFFFSVKSFAAGVILATAFIHILPDAFARLTSPCLPTHPWHVFPFAGLVAMLSAMGTMMLDSFANGYFRRSHFRKARPLDDEMMGGEGGAAHAGHLHVHTHASHGHAHGAGGGGSEEGEGSMEEKIRHRIISQVIF